MDMIKRMQRALAIGGNCYSIADIKAAIDKGDMQCFARGETAFVVTEIGIYPRKKVLSVVALCGKLDDVMSMQPELIAFAKKHGCDFITSFGRAGWARVLPKFGWRRNGVIHVYDLGGFNG